MAELLLDRQTREGKHSKHFAGRIATGSRFIPVLTETPHEADGASYLFVTGFLGTAESMKRPMCVAAQKAKDTIAITHASTNPLRVVARNTQDIVEAVQIMPGKKKHIVALSQGGGTVARAMAQFDETVRSVTLVAPARHIKGDNPWTMALRFMSMCPEEMADCLSDPMLTSRLAMASLVRFWCRPWAVNAEAIDLTTTTTFADLTDIANKPDRPHLRLAICSDDGIIPAAKLHQTAETYSVFDEVIELAGSHVSILFNRGHMQEILERDAALAA